ncbi:MAG: excisionase [Xylophilus ampelinus]
MTEATIRVRRSLQRPTPSDTLQKLNAARFVTIELAATLTGLTANAVRKRIERGHWLEGHQWKTGLDGRIWIDMQGVEKWLVETA